MSDDAPTLFHFDDDRPSFEDLGRDNGATHWDEPVVMDALGYESRDSFRKAVTRAKQACLSLNIQCEEHFILQGNGDHAITRFGCYLVAMNGDPRKKQVAEAQAYFATIAETFQTHLEHAEALDRVLIRDEVSEGMKSLSSVAKRHGVSNYPFFLNAGYRGMYDMNLKKLMAYKGLDPKKDKFLDRIGRTELAANLFRVTQTEEKIRRENIQGQQGLEHAAHHVGQIVRGTMKKTSGTTPENLPAADDIKKVKRTIKGTRKQMARVDKKKRDK